MSRIDPKTKRARRVGEPLRDKDTKYLIKRNYPPGMHGQARRRRSDYAIQLLEKQKAKWMYLVNERQFRGYVEASARKKQLTAEVLLEFLESRLDNVVYRLGFARSRAAARQLVGHGFITVNGKRVNIPSYQVAVGDQIAIADNKRHTKYVQELVPQIRQFKTQDWLTLAPSELAGKVLASPKRDNTGSTVQMELIIEHYSR